jgi:hypothetical protein
MTAKKATPIAEPKRQDPKVLRVEPQNPMESRAETFAHTSLRPTVQAALTLMEYNKAFGEASINTLVDDLGQECKAASDGNLARTEALLIAQAHTLDAIFNNLSHRAAMNMGDYINPAETYLRLALKAQSQCRATLEALAAIKNPAAVAFVRQANIAHGPQQVNNGPDGILARAEKADNLQSKLLEQSDGNQLDSITKGSTSSGDPTMAAVGSFNGTKNVQG